MKYEHVWGEHEYGPSWRQCSVCGCSKSLDYTPGWPPGRTYFLPNGEYSGPHGQTEPPCTATPITGLFGGK